MMGGIGNLLKTPEGKAAQKTAQLAPELKQAMALQKVVSDQQNAKAQQQMQQQPNPQTILQQLQQRALQDIEQSLGGGQQRPPPGRQSMNKSVQGIGGAYQQQEKEKQQQMQKLAQAMSQKGVAGVPRRPVSRGPGPTRQFSGGGIVSFANGGSVREETAKKIQELRKQGYTDQQIKQILSSGLSPQHQRIIEEFSRKPERGTGPRQYTGPMPQPGQSGLPVPPPNIPDPQNTGAPVDTSINSLMESLKSPPAPGPTLPAPGGAVVPKNINPLETAMDQMTGDPAYQTMANPPPALPPGNNVPYAPAGGVKADPVMNSGIMSPYAADNEFRSAVKKSALEQMNMDPYQRQAESRGMYEKDMAGARRRLGDVDAKRLASEALNRKQTDPEQEARDRWIRTWLGMGNQSSAAGALRGAGIASQLTKEQQKARARKNAASEYGMAGDMYKAEKDLSKGLFDAGEGAFNTAADIRAKATGTAGGMANTELMAQMTSESNRINAMSNQIRAQGNVDAKTLTAVDNALSQHNALMENFQKALATDAEYMQANMAYAAAKADRDQEDADAAFALMQQAEQRISAQMNLQAETARINAFIEQMYRRAGIPMPSPSGANKAVGGGVPLEGSTVKRVR